MCSLANSSQKTVQDSNISASPLISFGLTHFPAQNPGYSNPIHFIQSIPAGFLLELFLKSEIPTLRQYWADIFSSALKR